MSTIRPRRPRLLAGALAMITATLTLGMGTSSAVVSTAAPGVGATTVERGAAGAPASFCGLVWGSLPRVGAASGQAGTVHDVRSGRHACYDRLVIDVAGEPGRLGYDVRYVDAVRAPGTGTALTLAGAADLQIVLRSPAYDDAGRATYLPGDPARLVRVADYRTFRQVARAGSFEGETTFGLGVRARLPFRVFVLDGPGSGARLVVDVAHRW